MCTCPYVTVYVTGVCSIKNMCYAPLFVHKRMGMTLAKPCTFQEAKVMTSLCAEK